MAEDREKPGQRLQETEMERDAELGRDTKKQEDRSSTQLRDRVSGAVSERARPLAKSLALTSTPFQMKERGSER